MHKILAAIAAGAMLVALADPAAAAGRHDGTPGIHDQVADFSSQARVYGRYYVRGGRHYVRSYVVPRYYGYGARYYPPYPDYSFYQPYPYYGPYPSYGSYPNFGIRPYFPFAPFTLGVW